jgi:hypothetical protein
MRRLIRRWLPSPERVREGRSLRWLAPLLARPWLWHIDRRGVALGAAVGVFFGFLIPIAQIPLSALGVLILRANLPVAVVSTLVSNPLTYAPIFLLAHRLGRQLLGAAKGNGLDEAAIESAGVWASLGDLGAPLFLGLAIFAVCGSVLAWCLVQALWLGGNAWRRRRVMRARRLRQSRF